MNDSYIMYPLYVVGYVSVNTNDSYIMNDMY